MKSKVLIYILLVLFPCAIVASENNEGQLSTKKERNFIRSGNKLYNEKRFAEAEVEYKKAIEANVSSEIASFNLASSLIRQQGSADPNLKNNPLQQATDILTNLATSAKDVQIASKAFYNLGNLAFNQEKYDVSIANYKNALRRNPDDDKARQNLRLAQLKKQQQDQQKKDDKKDDEKKDQDKEDKKDQEKQEDKKDKEDKKDQQQNKPENKENKEQPQQQGGNGNMSQDNVDKILKTMDNREKDIQQKVNASKMKEQERRRSEKQW